MIMVRLAAMSRASWRITLASTPQTAARPLGALGLAVLLAEQVGEEGVEADGVAIEEGLIVLLLAVEGGPPQHHGHVGVGVRGNPLGADQLGGLVVDRIDADDAGAFLFQRLEARLTFVIRHVPAVLQGHLGVDPQSTTSSAFSTTLGQAVCCSYTSMEPITWDMIT